MRVLGLDPGSRRTGYGVIERSGNRYVCIAHGPIAPPARLDLPHRIHAIAVRAGALMEQHAPDAVVVEEAFYHESVRSTLVLGHVRGALLVATVFDAFLTIYRLRVADLFRIASKGDRKSVV